jgi:hypothetical protein
MFQQPWSAALAGVFVIGVGITNAVRTEDKISAGPLTALGVFAVVGAIVARIKTGTWARRPTTTPRSRRAPMSPDLLSYSLSVTTSRTTRRR